MTFGRMGAAGLGFGRSAWPGGGQQVNTVFGVNMSGAEFSPVGGGPTWPSAADWAYLERKGITFVRLPIAWEGIQPTLSAALNATYSASLLAAIAAAYSHNIRVLVDVHNFGHYVAQAQWTTTVSYAGNAGAAGPGVSALGDATLTSAAYTDLMTRLATLLLGNPGVLGVGIMNEPTAGIVGTNLLTTPNYFNGADWFVLNASVRTQLGAGTNPLGAGFGPAWTITSGSGFASAAQAFTFAATPYTLSAYASCAAGTETMFLQIAATSANKTVTTTPTRFTHTVTPSAGASSIQIGVGAVSGHTITISNAQLELGSSATTYAPSVWTPYAQAAVTAYRLVDATMPLYVCGFGFAKAATWTQNNFEMSSMTGGGLVFEAHQYFDGAQAVGGGGTYSGTYTSYSIDNNSGTQAIAGWQAWLVSQGVAGFLGEFGVPNNATDNNPQWLILQNNVEVALAAASTKGATWFYGSGGAQPSNILNVVPVAGVDDARLAQMLAVH